MAAPNTRSDPKKDGADPEITYRYRLEIGGITTVRFTKLSGLKMSTKVDWVPEGGNNIYKQAMIGGQTFDPLVIEKGFYSARDHFFQWMKKMHDPTSQPGRQSVSVIMHNDKGEATGRFDLYGAFIMEYEGPTFDSKAKEIAFEKMKLHYDFFEYKKAS
jgi:phage tail-like protein